MSIESFGLIEHFDYMKSYIHQPFYINSADVDKLEKLDDEYSIVTRGKTFILTKQTVKKLVDALGVKIKLLSAVCDETDVIDLVLPAVNKLFKCFADCFVFYAASDDPLTIIDVNVNKDAGDEGTKYENGPSPWMIDLKTSADAFTCFNNFIGSLELTDKDTDVLVKASDIMPSVSQVIVSIFKDIKDSALQPMLVMSSKFSNMNGFSKVNPLLYDHSTGISIKFPMNYAKGEMPSFDTMWKKVTHLHETTDLNDYIFREMSELVASNETPTNVKTFISDILTTSTLNVNQPIRDILNEANNLANTFASNGAGGKAARFRQNVGNMVGWCLVAKHECCASCGHFDLA